ncbi:GNAT family N-acetyltransferase [Alphaproteobacteria bacterium]|nr:GNAT family N-acetyltransferase [Alphaproteobacteria bacterium]
MLLNKVRENVDIKQSNGQNLKFLFKDKIFQIKPLSKNRIFPNIEFGDFIIKLADTKSELKKAQALRYSVFFKEKKAKPTFPKKIMRLDYDKIDKYADHLIVIDKKRQSIKNKIVGTYRLIRGDIASCFGGFYTSSEFDLTNIFNSYKHEQILELGRSCVHKDYRNGTTMNLLWKAIAEYIKLYDINVLLGCASFPGTDVQKFSKQLSYLRSNFSLPDKFSVQSLVNNNYPVNDKNDFNESDLRIFAKLPPLIKGYLRVGGRISDSFFVDYDFNTIDLCVVVKTENIDEKYKNKYLN